MTYTLTQQNLPEFREKITYILAQNTEIKLDIVGDDIYTTNEVDEYRKSNPGRSEEIRSDLKKNPDKRDRFVTLDTNHD